jgi:diguanylate cyclase (GGDEF)-like protein
MANSESCPKCGVSPVGARDGAGVGAPLRDPVTGAISRRLLLEAAEPVLSLARRNARTMAFLHVHLEGLTRWTADLPEERAHRILRGINRRIQRALRDSDFVARVEGDRFVIVLTEIWETDAAVRVAHRLVHQLSRSRGRSTPLNVRVGVAFFPYDADDVESLMTLSREAAPEDADRSGIGFADPVIGAEALRRAGLQRDLAGQDVARRFLLHYQPIFSMASYEAVGVEALIRWDHALQGVLPAGDFIPLAERTGRVRALDQWALEQALRDSKIWQAEGWAGWVSVNLSGRTLSDARLVGEVERLLDDVGADPSSLVLEVTESAALTNGATDVLEGLRDLGVWVAIDDFGTGYASFEYLRGFDPDLVKLDGVFVPTDDSPRQRRLINSMVTMAHHMGKPVVVEGVEEERQRERLIDSGCDMVQGYLLGRPMEAAEFARRHLSRENAPLSDRAVPHDRA